MADVNITSFEGLQAASTSVQSGLRHLQMAGDTLNSNPFAGLAACDPDLITPYINVLAEALTATYDLANKTYNAIEVLATEPLPDDPGETPTDPGDGNGNGGGGVNTNPPGTSGGGSVTPPQDGDTETPPEVEEPTVEEPELEPMDIDTSVLRDLPLKEIDGVVDTIIGLAENKKLGIDEYLESDDYSEELKQALLKSEFIPDDLKEQLLAADSIIVRKLFQAIMNGEFPEIFELNPLNIGAAYAYLRRVAEENGITVEQLLTDEQYTETLKGGLQSFDGVVDFCKEIDNVEPEAYQDKLLEVWDGSNIEGKSDGTVFAIRDYISYVAEQVSDADGDVAPEELLTNRDYAEVLKEATQQFAKSCVFLNSGAHMSDKGCRETIGGMMMGKNAKAMGMDKSTQEKFVAEVDNLAKQKGIKTETLLSDNQYADDIKDMLLNSENAQEVGAIYMKDNSDVSQHAVKNLYENKITNDTSVYSFVPENTSEATSS